MSLPEPQPMSTFRPDVACIVYDELNNEFFRWDPEWADNCRRYTNLQFDEDRGVVEWSGNLLAGWFPDDEAEALGFPADRTVKHVTAPTLRGT